MSHTVLSFEHRDMMLHALGWNYGWPYRNCYMADPGSLEDAEWADLCGRGLAELASAPTDGFPHMCYIVTDAGVDALMDESMVLKCWTVRVESGGEVFTGSVYARTRSQARAIEVRDLIDAWQITWREAIGYIVGVWRDKKGDRRAPNGSAVLSRYACPQRSRVLPRG